MNSKEMVEPSLEDLWSDYTYEFRWIVCNIGLLPPGCVLESPIFWTGDPYMGVETMHGWRLEVVPSPSSDTEEKLGLYIRMETPSKKEEKADIRYLLGVSLNPWQPMVAREGKAVFHTPRGQNRSGFPDLVPKDRFCQNRMGFLQEQEDKVTIICRIDLGTVEGKLANKIKVIELQDRDVQEGLGELGEAMMWERHCGSERLVTDLLCMAAQYGLPALERSCLRELTRRNFGIPPCTYTYVSPDSSDVTCKPFATVPVYACHIRENRVGLHTTWEKLTPPREDKLPPVPLPTSLAARGRFMGLRAIRSDPQLVCNRGSTSQLDLCVEGVGISGEGCPCEPSGGTSVDSDEEYDRPYTARPLEHQLVAHRRNKQQMYREEDMKASKDDKTKTDAKSQSAAGDCAGEER